MCGFCVVFQSVSSPVAGMYCASAARVSIAVGISRCWMIRSLTTTSAFLKAASTSPPLTVQWNAWLPAVALVGQSPAARPLSSQLLFRFYQP